MLPSQRGEVRQQSSIRGLSFAPQRVDGSFQVDRIPQRDSGGDQRESAGAVLLLLETAITDFTKAVEEYGSCERIAGFALV